MNGTAHKDHQREYHRAWDLLTPPLKPHQQVVEAIAAQVGGLSGRKLLLGVTPELATVADDLIALDFNLSMVRHIWPGDTLSRHAVVGDWRRPNFASAAFTACIGDGSLSFLRCPDEIGIVLRELKRVLLPGGKLVCRLFAAPAPADTLSGLREEALAGSIRNFHSFKLRLGMALASDNPDFSVGVATIMSEFNSMFADRAELASRTNWNPGHIDTIDYYEGSHVRYSFPTKDRMLSIASTIFPNARLVNVGTYEMAMNCPLLIAEKDLPSEQRC